MNLDEALAEIDRLKSGRFTYEEIHDICHNLHGTVSALDFARGCTAEQRKLYGEAPLEKLLLRYLDNHCANADAEGMSTLCECRLCLDTRAAIFGAR